jgi:hypothetical protein
MKSGPTLKADTLLFKDFNPAIKQSVVMVFPESEDMPDIMTLAGFFTQKNYFLSGLFVDLSGILFL